jgi:hypothetical protein
LIAEQVYLLDTIELNEEFGRFGIPNGRHSEFNRHFELFSSLLIEVERSITEDTVGGLSLGADKAKRCAYRVTILGAGAECAAIYMLSTLCAFVLYIEKRPPAMVSYT